MSSTCDNVGDMSKMIQIRHVPDDVHRSLKIKAAAAGMSLSDYLLAEVTQVANRMTIAEIRERVDALGPPLEFTQTSAEIIRRERDGR